MTIYKITVLHSSVQNLIE